MSTLTAPPLHLLEPHELAEAGPPEAVRLPLDLLDPSALNPRAKLLEIDALADSIADFGLLQPITVRRLGERYELLGGHRRWAAFLMLAEREPYEAKWRTIPAVVRNADDDRAYLMLLTGQLHSRNWQPREEASALERLAETRTLREVGALVHRTEPWVSKRLRIYADSVLSAFVQTKRLAPGVAEELLLVKDAAQRREFAERAVAEGWGQVEARAAVRSLRIDKELREVAKRARDLLNLLSAIDPTRVPRGAAEDLLKLRNRIDALATGKAPRFPSMEQAQKVAGVNPEKVAKQRRTRLKID